MGFLFWAFALTLFFVYLGFPILLALILFFKGEKPVQKAAWLPDLTLIISAYNEAKTIRQKIENSLELDYPKERLEVLIVSDASTDETDAIVKEYQDRGIRLVRMKDRRGKTVGLNHAVSIAAGEIIVFSDANAFYERDSLRHLADNFSDPEVGYVTGASRYIQKTDSFVGWCENLYWNYDLEIKRMESALGSMVGADGAIYAIRKSLYTPLQPQDINDFLNPLQIIAKRYRGIFEPKAVCREKTVTHFREEYRRKVRIVSRSLRGLAQMAVLLNPAKSGFYGIALLTHKLLRWFTPLLLLGIALSNVALWRLGGVYWLFGVAQILFYALALSGAFLSFLGVNLRLFYLPYYFCLMNFASLHAIWKASIGSVQATWEPERENPAGISNRFKTGLGLLLVFLFLLTAVQSFDLSDKTPVLKGLFWCFTGLILYNILGYSAIMTLVSLLIRPFKQTVENRESFVPAVTLLISAFNEDTVIAAKIENSLALDYPKDKLKIVVVSDGSTDETNRIVASYADRGIHLWHYQPRRGKISIINRAMIRVEDDIVLLSDANVSYDRQAVRNLVKHFQNPSVGAVSGSVTVVNAPSRIGMMELIYQRYENYIKAMETQIGSIAGVDGAMYAIRKDLYQTVQENVILDDLVISMNIARQGKMLLFEPAAKGYEHAVVSVREGFWTRVRVIAGAVQAIKQRIAFPRFHQPFLMFKFISHKILRWGMPLLLAGLLGVNLFLTDQAPYIAFLILQLIFYTLGLIGFISGAAMGFLSIPFYFCMQNVATFVGIWRGLSDGQSVMWDKAERFVAESDKHQIIEKHVDQTSH